MAGTFRTIIDHCRQVGFFGYLWVTYLDADDVEQKQFYETLYITLQCLTRQYAVPEDVCEASQRRFEQFDRQASDARWVGFIEQVAATTESEQLFELMMQNEVLMRELISGFQLVFENRPASV